MRAERRQPLSGQLPLHFCFGGGGVFTGAGFAPFFGFFFSLPCELFPLPITHLG